MGPNSLNSPKSGPSVIKVHGEMSHGPRTTIITTETELQINTAAADADFRYVGP